MSDAMRMPDTFTEKRNLNVIVETPKGSSFKYDYDPKLEGFKIKKSLPQGMHFPFSFGFLPATLGDDGDPLDIIILSEYPLEMGSIAVVALVGVLEAEQTEKDENKPIRNDRLVGCLVDEDDDAEAMFANVSKLPEAFKWHVEAFFKQYDKLTGKTFKPLGWHGPNHANTLVEIGVEKASKKE